MVIRMFDSYFLEKVNESSSASYAILYWFNGFVTRVTIRVPHVEQELLILPGHLNSLPALVRFVLIDILFSVWCCIDHCLSFSFLPDTTLCDKVGQ